MKKWKVHFIPQTHWDKEWYFTKYVSDVFLIDNIDKIYDIYKRDENEFESFVYDGQYSIIDDYLSYYPENEYKIRELVAAGKMIIGPWYTQTDTFNASGESIVRNLLVGTKNSEKYGKTMHVGYIPDSFGFNANLPQILKKANLKALIHWRGIYQDQIKNGVFNLWQGIDGTQIPIYNLYKWGYGVGVGPSFERFQQKWTLEDMPEQAKIYLQNAQVKPLPILEQVSQNTNGLILMPFGSDQLPIYDGLRQWIEELNKIDSDHEWVLSDYDKFVDELLTINQTSELDVIQGELRFGQFSRTHKTITSSRYDIKQLVKQAEYLIYEETEPLGIMFEQLGGKYPANIIDKNVRKLLESQAHDSLGGCNTDETNNTIVERLESILNSLESLNTLMKKRITEAADLKPDQIAIFNLKPYTQTIEKELWIYTAKPSFSIKQTLNSKKTSFNVLEQKHINIEEFKMYESTQLSKTKFKIDPKGQWWTKIFANFGSIDGMSFGVFDIKQIEQKFDLKAEKRNTIENNYKSLILQKNGAITLLDKKTNKKIKDAFVLVSDFDAGDSYDFSPSKNNPYNTANFISATMNIQDDEPIKKAVIDYTFMVPKYLDSEELIEQNLQLTIVLNKNSFDFNFNILNVANDIRWRLICETDISSDYSFADTSFGIIKRPVYLPEMEIWEEQKWHDTPIEIEAMESVVTLKNSHENYNIFSKGNNEYEIVGENYSQIAITLFRAYSAIGRRYLKYRPGRASGIDAYPHQTLNANLHKPLTIDLAFAFNINKNLVRQAKNWATDLVYYQNQKINQFHWKGDTFIMAKRPLPEIKKIQSLINFDLNDNLVISGFKKSYDEKGYILRIYNPSIKEIDFIAPNNFQHVDLLEQKTDLENNIFKPNEVKTYFLDQLK